MLKIAICDDNPTFLHNAVQLIRDWSTHREIPVDIFTFDNGDELIKKNSSCHMDIIFLDIIMPLLNGMDTAKELRLEDTSVKIIFLTSSPEFALESYDVKAFGYLLKPVACDKVKELLNECANMLSVEPKSLVAKTSFGYQQLYFHDIEYAEAQNKKVLFYLKSGRVTEITETLHSLEDRLTEVNGFFKCHRSYIVYMPNVDHFNSTEIVTKCGRNIPIARGCAKVFKEAYFSLMFQE